MMNKKNSREQRRTRKPWKKSLVFLVIGVGLLAVCLYAFVSINHQTPTHAAQQPAASSSQIHLFTTPESVMQQYFHDVMTNQYADIYTLFSAKSQQAFKSAGGVPYLKKLMQPFIDKYGEVVTYAFDSQKSDSSTHLIMIFTLHRTKLLATQSEKDTFSLTYNGKSWGIDYWSADIESRS